MTKKNLLAGLILLLAGSLFLAGCGAQQTPTAAPTVDANMIYTQAAQTVQAGLAQTEAALPATDTPAAEATTQATATMDPNVALALTATAQSVQPGGPTATTAPGQPTATTAAGQPTATRAALPTATTAVVNNPPKNTGDKAELVSQDPTDGTTVGKKDVISTTITLKNVGTTTWKKGTYGLAFYAGDRLGSPKDFQMPHDVKPGETIALIFTLTAPDSSGTKKVIWVVHNADGVNFYNLWLELNVS